MKLFLTIIAAIIAAVFILGAFNWMVIAIAACVAVLACFPARGEYVR